PRGQAPHQSAGRRPRGDRSCDAAKTTRGLLASPVVVRGARYGRLVGHTLLDGLDAQQRAAVVSEAAPLAIVAPAGSGKTRVLTRPIPSRTAGGTADARRVLALTFMRKAAGELVDRLHSLGIGGPVTAGTFHAIALAELRRRAIERGHEPPRVLD